MPDLTILHTNDLHGKLTEHGGHIIARERASCERCLLLDSGDAIPSGNIYYRPGGEIILARMSDLGYDAMAMGNREFHFLSAGLKSKLSLARFPILCANLRSRGRDLGQSVQPSLIANVHGLKVGVFGLTVPMITKRMLASKFSKYWFEDPLAIAAELVPAIRSQSDFVIGLTHIGLHKDLELAASVIGIDLIVAGHSHSVLHEPEWAGKTPVVEAGWWGHYLGKTEVTLSKTPGGIPEVREQLIDLR